MQERFRSLIPSYIRDSSVAVVVYDITSKWPRPQAQRQRRGVELTRWENRPGLVPEHIEMGGRRACGARQRRDHRARGQQDGSERQETSDDGRGGAKGARVQRDVHRDVGQGRAQRQGALQEDRTGATGDGQGRRCCQRRCHRQQE
ncbi:hypothetical protein Golomagni_08408 [Golovinomyces magnicellulatus]|nr:hypothetical protein Golomagni_08408 [Golovinomyces magnicellulatus]